AALISSAAFVHSHSEPFPQLAPAPDNGIDMPSLMVSAWAKVNAANRAIAKPALIDIAFLVGAFIVSSDRVRMAQAPDPYELESPPQKRVKLVFALVPYPGIVAGEADMPEFATIIRPGATRTSSGRWNL